MRQPLDCGLQPAAAEMAWGCAVAEAGDPAAGTLPAGSIHLADGFQGGIYRLAAPIEPPGQGVLYVRAFDALRGHELSGGRIRRASEQPVRVAGDAPVRYTTRFTVYEGDWGDHYPARVEVWFEPAGDGEPRRLVGDTFRVEGWMR